MGCEKALVVGGLLWGDGFPIFTIRRVAPEPDHGSFPSSHNQMRICRLALDRVLHHFVW
jgi:hypothetical protein